MTEKIDKYAWLPGDAVVTRTGRKATVVSRDGRLVVCRDRNGTRTHFNDTLEADTPLENGNWLFAPDGERVQIIGIYGAKLVVHPPANGGVHEFRYTDARLKPVQPRLPEPPEVLDTPAAIVEEILSAGEIALDIMRDIRDNFRLIGVGDRVTVSYFPGMTGTVQQIRDGQYGVMLDGRLYTQTNVAQLALVKKADTPMPRQTLFQPLEETPVRTKQLALF